MNDFVFPMKCLERARIFDAPLKPYRPFKTIGDRDFWEGLSEGLKTGLISEGESALNKEYPVIKATDFMAFKRTGNRVAYEDLFFEKRYMLNSLVLSECVENKGRFIDKIIDGIWSVCEESTWILPAHNSYIRNTPQDILPEVTRPIIELFSCETGAMLAMVRYLIKDSLDKISPLICDRIATELKKRIIEPYVNEHFWWMGKGSEPMCNWTPWCTSNVLLTAFLCDDLTDINVKRRIFEKAAASVDYFLKDYGDDGCCDEGAQYYRHAGLCLFSCLDILNNIAPGHFDLFFKDEKIKNIAAYIAYVHIDGPWYINFADCSPKAGRCGVREYLFAKACDLPNLKYLAASDFVKTLKESALLKDESQRLNLYYRTQSVYYAKEVCEAAGGNSLTAMTPDMYYESVGLWILRSKSFTLAVKAGDNDDSHNHNDVGSFTLFKDGHPAFVDIGVETYTGKTFSERRYEIWTMQSCYHNLPTIRGLDELPGADHKATNIEYSLDEKCANISFNIERAYPEPVALGSYERNIFFDKEKDIITLTDVSSCDDVILNFIVYEKPVINDNNIIVGNAHITLQSGQVLATETLPITDARLKTAWDHDLYRIRIKSCATTRLIIK